MLQNALRASRPLLVPQLRGAKQSQTRLYGFGSHVADNDPETLEKEKQKQLKGTRPGTHCHPLQLAAGKTVSHIKQVPGWNEHLASDSEAVVKAERECPDCPIDEMQRQTVDTLKEEEEEDASTQDVEPKSGAMGGA
ncbi:hypothetical protein CHLNCDRAFT_137786 [Chlorella variabilis]|uniref:Uncharacterized protein n=1 Tax=Chlorella variabilis TaxID=554065 RepID=E1Z4H7_CHLVA|nr:hypothetical protein CHLNCDRAFT_137786 [Chlorella variabilis]EFN59345.1 hypothetical protein CHLNCDRAFT_137786 [Chlorella variabilis]|eukprot:XP_005851447.1 hypothetical protein CHLNCDRAFT_137786 [Chlorella variabilis]